MPTPNRQASAPRRCSRKQRSSAKQSANSSCLMTPYARRTIRIRRCSISCKAPMKPRRSQRSGIATRWNAIPASRAWCGRSDAVYGGQRRLAPCPPSHVRMSRMVARFALPTLRIHGSRLVPQFRLHDGLANLGAAVGAFIGEVDLRHAPMRLDVAHIHLKSDAARTNDEGWLCVIVIMDIGWHVGSPQEDTQESIHQ